MKPSVRARSPRIADGRASRAVVLGGCLLVAAVTPLHLVLSVGFGHVHLDHGVQVFHQHGNLGPHEHAELGASGHPRAQGADHGDGEPEDDPAPGSGPRTFPVGASPALQAGVPLDALTRPAPPTIRESRPERAPRVPLLSREPGAPRGPPRTAAPPRFA